MYLNHNAGYKNFDCGIIFIMYFFNILEIPQPKNVLTLMELYES